MEIDLCQISSLVKYLWNKQTNKQTHNSDYLYNVNFKTTTCIVWEHWPDTYE